MADTSKGDATEEIIQFHMVPDMRKAFSKFAKEHKCKYVISARVFTGAASHDTYWTGRYLANSPGPNKTRSAPGGSRCVHRRVYRDTQT